MTRPTKVVSTKVGSTKVGSTKVGPTKVVSTKDVARKARPPKARAAHTDHADTQGPPLLPAAARRPYDVVALVASAGGNGAVATVLRSLPRDFALPVVVLQHFPGDAPDPLRSLRASLPFKVEWAVPGAVLASGRVVVVPPRSFLEILPDSSCALSPCPRGPWTNRTTVCFARWRAASARAP